MTEMPTQRRPNWWKRVGLLIAVSWVVFFGYLLLAADPPDFWFEDIGSVDGPGHVVGGFVTGFLVSRFVARRRRPFLLAVAVAVAFLVGLEVVQDLFTDRGYERSDVVLSVVGAGAGVASGQWGLAAARRLREMAQPSVRKKRP